MNKTKRHRRKKQHTIKQKKLTHYVTVSRVKEKKNNCSRRKNTHTSGGGLLRLKKTITKKKIATPLVKLFSVLSSSVKNNFIWFIKKSLNFSDKLSSLYKYLKKKGAGAHKEHDKNVQFYPPATEQDIECIVFFALHHKQLQYPLILKSKATKKQLVTNISNSCELRGVLKQLQRNHRETSNIHKSTHIAHICQEATLNSLLFQEHDKTPQVFSFITELSQPQINSILQFKRNKQRVQQFRLNIANRIIPYVANMNNLHQFNMVDIVDKLNISSSEKKLCMVSTGTINAATFLLLKNQSGNNIIEQETFIFENEHDALDIMNSFTSQTRQALKLVKEANSEHMHSHQKIPHQTSFNMKLHSVIVYDDTQQMNIEIHINDILLKPTGSGNYIETKTECNWFSVSEENDILDEYKNHFTTRACEYVLNKVYYKNKSSSKQHSKILRHFYDIKKKIPVSVSEIEKNQSPYVTIYPHNKNTPPKSQLTDTDHGFRVSKSRVYCKILMDCGIESFIPYQFVKHKNLVAAGTPVVDPAARVVAGTPVVDTDPSDKPAPKIEYELQEWTPPIMIGVGHVFSYSGRHIVLDIDPSCTTNLMCHTYGIINYLIRYNKGIRRKQQRTNDITNSETPLCIIVPPPKQASIISIVPTILHNHNCFNSSKRFLLAQSQDISFVHCRNGPVVSIELMLNEDCDALNQYSDMWESFRNCLDGTVKLCDDVRNIQFSLFASFFCVFTNGKTTENNNKMFDEQYVKSLVVDRLTKHKSDYETDTIDIDTLCEKIKQNELNANHIALQALSDAFQCILKLHVFSIEHGNIDIITVSPSSSSPLSKSNETYCLAMVLSNGFFYFHPLISTHTKTQEPTPSDTALSLKNYFHTRNIANINITPHALNSVDHIIQSNHIWLVSFHNILIAHNYYAIDPKSAWWYKSKKKKFVKAKKNNKTQKITDEVYTQFFPENPDEYFDHAEAKRLPYGAIEVYYLRKTYKPKQEHIKTIVSKASLFEPYYPTPDEIHEWNENKHGTESVEVEWEMTLDGLQTSMFSDADVNNIIKVLSTHLQIDKANIYVNLSGINKAQQVCVEIICVFTKDKHTAHLTKTLQQTVTNRVFLNNFNTDMQTRFQINDIISTITKPPTTKQTQIKWGCVDYKAVKKGFFKAVAISGSVKGDDGVYASIQLQPDSVISLSSYGQFRVVTLHPGESRRFDLKYVVAWNELCKLKWMSKYQNTGLQRIALGIDFFLSNIEFTNMHHTEDTYIICQTVPSPHWNFLRWRFMQMLMAITLGLAGGGIFTIGIYPMLLEIPLVALMANAIKDTPLQKFLNNFKFVKNF